MKLVLLVALVGALLVAGSAAGPIVPVAAKPSAKPESEYVFVKLLFEGHDQPNFDKWHANATAAAVAKAGGVPVNYLIRLVDGKFPGTKEAAPAAKPILAQPVPIAPVTGGEPVAPVTATTPLQEPTPIPAAAAPTAVTAPTAPAPATAPTVTLIQEGAAKPAEPEQKAVLTKPESGEGDLAAPAVPTAAPAVPATPAPQNMGLWETVQNALASNRAARQNQQEGEPEETPVTDRPRRPRVFVLGGRKLFSATQIAPNQAIVEYAIKTNASEPWAVRETVKRKLMASAANFGMAQGTSLKGFYTLLKENGVGYFPSMWVDGEQILSGQVGLEAPHNRFTNGSTKNFQHKLYKHTDLVKPKVPVVKNGTNATVVEPSFIMANRSTSTAPSTTSAQPPHKSGMAPWAAALIALGAIAVALALAGTAWRCVKQRRKRQAEEDAAHSEPLSPHSVVSHNGM